MINNVYVIYDQFHWKSKDHLEVPVTGFDNGLNTYRFYRSSYPNESLGFKSLIEYNKLKSSYYD